MSKAIIVLAALMISGFTHANAEPPPKQNSIIVVYYFHRTVRCPSCTLLEELTRETVQLGFDQWLQSGRITTKVINVDERDNEHFINDYSLSVQSVVLSEIDNGNEKRWKNLDQIWTLLEDQEQLWEYLQKEIQEFLDGT